MFSSFRDFSWPDDADVCVVGSGPVGIAVALGCEARGLRVVLVESGSRDADAAAAALGASHQVDESRHARPEVAMRRGFGGTSTWWGGRCVPLDPVDFADRPHVPAAAWPIAYEDVAPWLPAAAEFFGIGEGAFRLPSTVIAMPDVELADLERWCPFGIAAAYDEKLRLSSKITVVLGATVTQLNLNNDGSRVVSLTIADATRSLTIRPPDIVLAAGGLETTRLLLAARDACAAWSSRFAALGCYYMGHISGKIADIVWRDGAYQNEADFFLDGACYVRRRLTIRREVQAHERLLNIAFWPDNPRFAAPDHGNGLLSLAWLALASPLIGRLLASEGVRQAHVGAPPYRPLRHLANVLRSPVKTALEAYRAIRAQYFASPKRPGFLVTSASGRYALHFHGEQVPSPQSRVTLAAAKDALGLPFLKVDLAFSPQDAQSVLRAHEVLDDALRRADFGRLEYYDAEPRDRLARILSGTKDGFHQIGTTRMGRDPRTSVVNEHCRVHGVDNLHIASSAVFPSSGQANPTFTAVALGLRLCEAIATARQASTPRTATS